MKNYTKQYRYLTEVRVSASRALQLVSILLVAFLLIVPSSVEARLGESIQKCSKRYGSPIGSIKLGGLADHGVKFHRGEYSIICGFEDNKCVVMLVSRVSPINPNMTSIPRDDVTLFMTDNFGHTSWVLTKLEKETSTWKTYDLQDYKHYVAIYDTTLQRLTMKIDGY